MVGEKYKAKKGDSKQPEILQDRMKISTMAKFPKEFKREFCTELDSVKWIPTNLQQLIEEETETSMPKSTIPESIKEEEEDQEEIVVVKTNPNVETSPPVEGNESQEESKSKSIPS